MPRSGPIPRVKVGEPLTAELFNRLVDAVNKSGFAVEAPLEMADVGGVRTIRDSRPSVVFARITGALGSPAAHTWRGVFDRDGMLNDYPANVTDNGVDYIYEAQGLTLPSGTVVIARRLPGSMKLWTQSDACP